MEQACRSSNSKLERLSEEESECTIYRVHQHLRNVNAGAYEPQIISIGPYHRGKPHLKMMENHKRRYLQSHVKRTGLKADEFARAVSGVESSKARKCYANQDFSLTESEFIEMLVLDGCFIIELGIKYLDWCSGGQKDDPIFQMPWMINSLRRDLMLFENQIPFFVLLILFHPIKSPNEIRTLLQRSLTVFFRNLYLEKGHSGELLQGLDHKIKHLLDLIHRNWVHPRLQQLNSKKKDKECQKPNRFRWMCCKTDVEECQKPNRFRTMCCMPLQERKENEVVLDSMPVLESNETDFNETDVEIGSGTPLQDEENEVEMSSGIFINHATELTEANVEFKKKENDKKENDTILFDVHFRDGAMEMPSLRIEDGTECFLRNLIVYEQYFQQELSHTVVTDYMKLLDNLIDSAKDVEILRRKGIIINWLGDAEVVANMVNKLGDLVIYNTRNFSYATVFRKVNEHCEKRWNRWMAKLRRDYLNSPWAIISIIAAVVLLLLTVTQTVLSILQVVQEN